MIRTGARFYDKLTQVEDLQAGIRELDSEALKMVSDFLETMPSGGIPGLISALVMTEKIRRFDASIGDFGNMYAEGATTAEGIESGLRGEIL